MEAFQRRKELFTPSRGDREGSFHGCRIAFQSEPSLLAGRGYRKQSPRQTRARASIPRDYEWDISGSAELKIGCAKPPDPMKAARRAPPQTPKRIYRTRPLMRHFSQPAGGCGCPRQRRPAPNRRRGGGGPQCRGPMRGRSSSPARGKAPAVSPSYLANRAHAVKSLPLQGRARVKVFFVNATPLMLTRIEYPRVPICRPRRNLGVATLLAGEPRLSRPKHRSVESNDAGHEPSHWSCRSLSARRMCS